MKKPYGYIYRIESPSGKFYIGQTINFKKRMDYYRLKRCKSQTNLYRAIVKYGWENMKAEVLHICKSKEEMNELEGNYILLHDSIKNGYNCMGICNCSQINENTKTKMSINAKQCWELKTFRDKQTKSSFERWQDPEFRKRVMNARLSSDGKRKASAARKKVWKEKRESMMIGQKKRNILTDEQVFDIRNSELGIRKTSVKLGVAFDTVRKCRLGVTYKHLPMAIKSS
jgi:group I intron endonuclease